MFPGQNYVPMENKMLRPPGNYNTGFIDGSIRKRKSTAMDQFDPKHESTYGYSVPMGSNLPKGNSFRAQVEDQAYGFYSNQTKMTEPTNFKPQFEKDQFHYQNSNSNPGHWVSNNGNYLPNGTQNLINAPSPSPLPLPPPPPPLSSDSRGSFNSLNMHAPEGIVRPVSQSLGYSVLNSQQGNQSLSNGGFSNVGSASLPHGAQFSGGTGLFGVPSGEFSQTRQQGNGDASVRTMETVQVMKSLEYPLHEISPNKFSLPKATEASQKNDPVLGSLSSDQKNNLDCGKAASAVAEKLWEGSLQLSSSVTVASVAFYKSGEKLLNSNWYESVEVKGKVRLEAFEKYIQDLPQSRNKGLMIVSLCWKEGSSEAGQKGMKEVARGYRKGNRVGFAHLSPEIHLYICPQSEAIITILRKYNFSENMEINKDTQDLMIGCVIWRKRTSSDAVAKKPELKREPPSKSPNQDSDSEDSPLAQLVQEIVAPLSATFSSNVQDDVETGNDLNKNGLNESQIGVINYSSGSGKPQNSCSSSIKLPQVNLVTVNNQPTNWLGPQQPKENVDVQNHAIPPPCKIVKETRLSDDDDDDLPEFNFMVGSGPSHSNKSKPLERKIINERFPPEVINNMDRPMQRGVSVEQAKSSPLPGETNQVMTSSVNNTLFVPRKNLFDDDDMPEWRPPELGGQSWAETAKPISLPSNFQNSNFQDSPRGPPFPSQNVLSRGHFHGAQPRPLQRGSSAEIGSSADSILGPPPGFHAQASLQRADKWPR